ncbi:hypothetical protein CRG98_025490, partial [Punica granatum]
MALAITTLRAPPARTRSPVVSDSVPTRSVRPTSLSWASAFPAINISIARPTSPPLNK